MTASTVLHIADRAYWDSLQATGRPYEMSTRDRTLAEEGFIHACQDTSQLQAVLTRFYADLDPADLVLLVIDTTRLDAPVRYEPADGDLFPHIYGPIPLSAVIEVRSVPGNR